MYSIYTPTYQYLPTHIQILCQFYSQSRKVLKLLLLFPKVKFTFFDSYMIFFTLGFLLEINNPSLSLVLCIPLLSWASKIMLRFQMQVLQWSMLDLVYCSILFSYFVQNFSFRVFAFWLHVTCKFQYIVKHYCFLPLYLWFFAKIVGLPM